MGLPTAQWLLREARARVLSLEEMERVIDWLYGSNNWAAIQFSVARPHVKQALFVSLIQGCGIDVSEIKTNVELFTFAAKRLLNLEEMDELMRTIYGARSRIYRQWAENPDRIAKECGFIGRMLASRVEIPPEVVISIINQ